MEKKNDNRPQPSRPPQGRRSPFGFWWVSAMIVVAILGIEYFYSSETTARELSQREFFTEVLPSGDVREVVVYNKDYANVFLTSDALKSGKLSGAAVDVLKSEPMSADCPLLSAPNLIITPHTGWAPLTTRKRLLNIVTDNIRAFLQGKPKNNVAEN